MQEAKASVGAVTDSSRERELERDVRRSGLLLFLIYFVQKSANYFEGFSKIPVRKMFKAASDEGGFGFSAAETSAFLTNSGLGWYIKS